MAGKKVTLYIVCMMTTIVFIGMNFPEVEASGGSFGGGTGTKNNPYVIEDVYDLQAMKNDLGAHYILKNDIDASQTKNWNSGAGFDPVGTYIWNDASKRFTGVLEGNNFTLTGLYIYRPIQDIVGLFGCIGSGGSVKNLRIIENNISGRNGVGGLIGSNYGTLSNCFSEGNITGGNEQIGGLIGSNSGKISNCYSFCNVSGKNHVGGLFGYNSAIIDNCSSSGTVKGLINIGGLIGNNYGELYNCYSVNNVNGTNSVGGLIGHNNYRNISKCYFQGKVNGSNSVGGLIGHGGGSISYSHSDSYVTGITQVGGIFGYYTYSTMKECYSKGNVFGSGSFVGGLIGYSIESSFISCYSTSNVKGESLVGGLIGDNYHYNWQVKVYECFSTGNVTGSGVLGGLIGRNHGRSNYCNISNSYSTGNVNSSLHLVGGLVGENDAKIINCYSTGNVKGANFVGGLLGKNNYGLISYSYSTGEVVGEMTVGGFIGLNLYIVLSNCYSTGNVEGIYWVGGFVGFNKYGSVLNCYAKGNVIGIREIAGGLAGRNDGSISISYSVGKVVGGSIKGGLVGYNKGTVSDSFWDISTSGQISSAGGTGKNTEQMKTRSTFTNASWNFSGIWNIIENMTYPFFQWQYYNNDPEMINTSLSSDKIPIGDYIYINCTFFDKDTGDDHTGTIQWGDGNITQGSIVNYTLIGSHYYENSGKYSIRIKISDSNGGSVSKTFNVTVTPKAKTGGPYVENEGSALCFNASGSLGENLSYRWDLDNDGTWDTNYSSDPTVNHTWYDDHSGYVTVEVYDGISTDTDTVEVTIYNVDPTVSFEITVPEMFVLPGERIYFIGEFSDPGTEDTHTINWSFGDGNYLVGDLEVNHSFEDPGTYNVTLTITDDDGGVGYYSAFITVIGQKEALEDLIEYIEDLGLNNGIQTSLVKKLENAIKKIDKGDDVDLKSFFNELDALKGKKISNSDYEYLYSLAQRIVS